MKKVLIYVFTAMLISVVVTSCKPRKPKCPAYKSQVPTASIRHHA